MMWAKVVGFNGKYFISDSGVLASTSRRTKGSVITDLPEKPSVVHPALKKDGYYGVCLKDGRTSKNVYIHRLVASAFVPNPDNKPQVNHKNGNKLDNRAENLEWVTVKENVNHAWETGLHGHINRGLRRLSDKDVRDIRKSTDRQRVLANKYGVCQSTISAIKNYKRYKEVS